MKKLDKQAEQLEKQALRSKRESARDANKAAARAESQASATRVKALPKVPKKQTGGAKKKAPSRIYSF